ncbi:MAG: DinB family protein [Candidatus Zixiibacteriota bacterium]
MPKTYRKGGVGAMMDEYERAAAELKTVLSRVTEEQFNRIVDTETKDDDCRSIQTIMRHVVRAGYGYANYFRTAWNLPLSSPESVPLQKEEAASKIDDFLTYTAQTLEGKWEYTDEQIQSVSMKVRWGVTYDLEQLLEHAIVHILRHRRQIERFLLRMEAK